MSTSTITASAAPALIHAWAHGVTASVENRTITGTITAFDRPSNDNRFVFHAGSIKPRLPLSRVKLLRDHDQTQPVGFMIYLSEDALTATFKVPEGPDGDRALAEAANGLRDGFSVGLIPSTEADATRYDAKGLLHIYDSEMHEVSLVAVPAFSDAGVISVAAAMTTTTHSKDNTMNRAQLAAALAAGQITQEEHDAKLAAIVTAEAATVQAPAAVAPVAAAVAPVAAAVPAEVAAGPVRVEAGASPALTTKARGLSLAQVVGQVAGAFNNGDPNSIRAALEDIIPADDEGTAWLGRDDWMGELFTAGDERRRWIEAWGGTKPLLTLTAAGWRWVTRPKGGKYAGNKTGIPSNKPKTTKARFVAERWAGGWDIDRAFIDFADPEFLHAFWLASAAEYNLDSDIDIATKTILAAVQKGPVTRPGSKALGVILAIAADMRGVRGAHMSQLFLSEDLYADYSELKISELPAWLANAVGGVEVTEGTARITPKLTIEADPLVPEGTGIGFDRRAATVREKTPIRVNQLDVAQAGVDLGFYSYGRFDLHDPRLIVARTANAAGTKALEGFVEDNTPAAIEDDEDEGE